MSDRYTSKKLTDHCFNRVNISISSNAQRDSISEKTYSDNFIKECINTEDSVKHFSSYSPAITSLFQATNSATIPKHMVQKNITKSIYKLILHKRQRLHSIILY